MNIEELSKNLPQEIQVAIGNKTTTAKLVGYSFAANQPLYEAHIEKKPRQPRNTSADGKKFKPVK